jgi:predicted ABC-type transport system involved in lysophospholipase L1 biosynthesis ATPase subunit
MAKELRRKLSIEAVAQSVSRNFGFVFQAQMLWLESIDALTGEATDVPLKVPEELRKLHREKVGKEKEEDTFWA